MSMFKHDVVQLVENMVEVFQRKKESKRISERITRGRASASASEFEDELARLIEKHTPEDILIFVDSPISYRPADAKRAKTIYPDIALFRENALFCILEAKIDLGYLDSSWAESRKETFKQLKSVGKVSVSRKQFNVSERLCSAGVVLTGRNHPERLPSFIKEVENAVILLSKEHTHPNDKLDGEARKTYIEKIANDKSHWQQWETFERFVHGIASFNQAV
jgi:hypothetical protein